MLRRGRHSGGAAKWRYRSCGSLLVLFRCSRKPDAFTKSGRRPRSADLFAARIGAIRCFNSWPNASKTWLHCSLTTL
jgi:hypothetical protein